MIFLPFFGMLASLQFSFALWELCTSREIRLASSGNPEKSPPFPRRGWTWTGDDKFDSIGSCPNEEKEPVPAVWLSMFLLIGEANV